MKTDCDYLTTMKKIVFLIVFLFCISNIFAQGNDSLVLFTKQIQWSSFKGAPNSDISGAKISTLFILKVRRVNKWNGTLLFKAFALMDPSKSWVKPGYADQYTLLHEQTHFNITQICAKKLQAELNQMKLKSRKSAMIEVTLTKWQSKMEVLQEQYDLETMYGNDTEAQKLWNEKIIAELISVDL